MVEKVIFHLAKQLLPFYKRGTIYEEIKAGRKTSEWRNATPYWCRRLFLKPIPITDFRQKEDLTHLLKVHKAWFVQGYPKGNLPRLETDIVGVIYHPFNQLQLEIKFTNVCEVVGEV